MGKSTWEDFKEKKDFPALSENITVDVAIIGGGITGITTAYLLSSKGIKTAVFEKNVIGGMTTAFTTALTTYIIDTRITDLRKMFGTHSASEIWKSGERAIDLIENIVETEKIDCEFMRCPAYFYALDESDIDSLDEDYQTAWEMGYETNINKDNKIQINCEGYWEIPNQAKIHPLKYLYKMADKVSENGGKIYENSEIIKLSRENPFILRTENGLIKSKYLISATYRPFNEPLELFLKKGMYTSYALEAGIPKDSLKEAIYWDIESPYNYFRVDKMDTHDRLIIGGMDHRDELSISPRKNHKLLEYYLRDILGDIGYTVKKRWSGPILEPVDGIPLIGEFKPNYFVASAFSGNGITYSHVAAMIFRDLILGISNPWVELYNPNRIPKPYSLLKKGADYTQTLFDGIGRKFFLS
jgi:glycine/D-amino acid oxidase-like deaminating enzyme